MRIIAGEFKNRQLLSVKGKETRPSTTRLRGALFNILAQEIEGAAVLDLFAGTGAIGLEALSRGASSATFVENNQFALRTLHANIARLGVESRTRVLASDVFHALKTLTRGSAFDLVYLDPPYDYPSGSIHLLLDTIRQAGLLNPNGQIFLECAKTLLDDERLEVKTIRRYGRTLLLSL